jgi:hypothetical protein
MSRAGLGDKAHGVGASPADCAFHNMKNLLIDDPIFRKDCNAAKKSLL